MKFEESKSTLSIANSESHRENAHFSSDSSDYETDESSDSSDCDEFFNNLRKSVVPAKLQPLTTKGELLIEDLPPVEDLHITVSSTELQKIGSILHWVIAEERKEFLVIVQSDQNSKPLDDDSVLFLSSDVPLGKIHDVFGSVIKPNYVVRFNSAEDIFDKGVTTGQTVYYSPTNGELTRYVLVDALKEQKGSDASWKEDNEPPEEVIDYSDDEQEKLAKQKRRAKTRGKERNWDAVEGQDVASNKMERRDASYSQQRVFKRASRNSFQSSMPGMSRNAVSPQSFGPPASNYIPFRPFLERNVPSPQPPGPFPRSNVPSPRPFALFPQSNVPSPQPPGPFPRSNVQSPQPPGRFPRNVPSPQPSGPFPHSNVPFHHSFGPFPQSSMSSYQPFTAPPTSYVLSSPSLAQCLATGAPQLNPPSLMAAPQNNVPLQQQMMLQSQQPFNSFLSHPPPNYNSHQNSRTFLRQPQSFTPPVFGALPAARPTMQNASNQLPANQMLFSSGANSSHVSLSGNLNISQSTNIAPTNSYGHQGQYYGMGQSNTADSNVFPPRNTQYNSIDPPNRQIEFASMQIAGPPISRPPRPTPPFVPCQTPPQILPSQTPPPSPDQQNFPIFSSAHLPVFQSQSPPPTVHFCTFPVPGDPMSAQNRRPF